MSLLDTASLVITPNGTKAGTLYSVVPSSGAGDMTVTRATTATRVNSAGLIESVASNVPRLDYSNGTCPSILVEPQRTNLALYSQQFTNGVWSIKSGTFTDNYGFSPDGTTNATRFVSTDSDPYVYQPITGDGSTYTVSCYVKGVGSSIGKNGSIRVSANSQSFAITNQWQRVTLTCTISGVLIMGLEIPDGASVGDEVLIWGYQCEQGSYATSYIPTTSASVTRNADVISKTGISSLIGQTEGTLFVDFNKTHTYSTDGELLIMNYANANPATNRVQFVFVGNNIELYATDGTNAVYSGTITSISNGRHKLAVTYGSGGYVVYLDGVSVFSNSATWSPTTDSFRIGSYATSVAFYSDTINSTSVWKTRLTNTQLAQLTTI